MENLKWNPHLTWSTGDGKGEANLPHLGERYLIHCGEGNQMTQVFPKPSWQGRRPSCPSPWCPGQSSLSPSRSWWWLNLGDRWNLRGSYYTPSKDRQWQRRRHTERDRRRRRQMRGPKNHSQTDRLTHRHVRACVREWMRACVSVHAYMKKQWERQRQTKQQR